MAQSASPAGLRERNSSLARWVFSLTACALFWKGNAHVTTCTICIQSKNNIVPFHLKPITNHIFVTCWKGNARPPTNATHARKSASRGHSAAAPPGSAIRAHESRCHVCSCCTPPHVCSCLTCSCCSHNIEQHLLQGHLLPSSSRVAPTHRAC